MKYHIIDDHIFNPDLLLKWYEEAKVKIVCKII